MYYYRQQIKGKFTDVEQLLVAALKDNGFGIITEIDVQKTLKEKMGVETAPHKILGACNPSYAHKALTLEPSIGVLLPCNVVIRQEQQFVIVESILPTVQLSKVTNHLLHSIAQEIEQKLMNAVDVALVKSEEVK